MGKNGGRRPGAGRKPGSKNKKTLERQQVEQAVKQRIMHTAQRILDAQFSIALGQQFLFKITTYKNGTKSRPELVTDEKTISKFLNDELNNNGDDEYHYITTKEPNNYAIDSMLNRALGKPVDSLEVSGRNGQPIVFTIPKEINDKHRIAPDATTHDAS